MANLIKCKHCQHEIAKTAKACPNCGGKNKKSSFFFKAIVFFIGFSFVINIVNALKETKQSTKATIVKQADPFNQVLYSKLRFRGDKRKLYHRTYAFYTDVTKSSELKKHCMNKVMESSQASTWCYYYSNKGTKYNFNRQQLSKDFYQIKEDLDGTKFLKRVEVYMKGKAEVKSKAQVIAKK